MLEKMRVVHRRISHPSARQPIDQRDHCRRRDTTRSERAGTSLPCEYQRRHQSGAVRSGIRRRTSFSGCCTSDEQFRSRWPESRPALVEPRLLLRVDSLCGSDRDRRARTTSALESHRTGMVSFVSPLETQRRCGRPRRILHSVHDREGERRPSGPFREKSVRAKFEISGGGAGAKEERGTRPRQVRGV